MKTKIPNIEASKNTVVLGFHFWTPSDKERYECQAVLCPEEGGGFSAHVANLPGAVTEGDSFDEALSNIREVFADLITTYREIGKEIPWGDKDLSFLPKECQRRWILVDA